MSERTDTPWTPGPWQIEGVQIKHTRQAGPALYYVTNVATVETEWVYDGDYEANARLIAEAPAMAELIQHLYDGLLSGLMGKDGWKEEPSVINAYEKARTILARVRGEETT